jgi:hypothetical protein
MTATRLRVSDLAPIPPEQQAAATAAHQMDRHIRETVARMKGLWVELAEGLYHFRAGEMWKDIGYPTFESWLADPEVELERRWVYKLTDAYKYLVIEWGVDRERVQQLHISKVNEVLPAIRRGQVQLEAALADVESLNRADLEIQYRGCTRRCRGARRRRRRPPSRPTRSRSMLTAHTAGRSTSGRR